MKIKVNARKMGADELQDYLKTKKQSSSYTSKKDYNRKKLKKVVSA